MFRKRLATLAVAAGLGLSLGCSSTNTACGTQRTGFFSRLCARCKNRGTTTAAAPVVDTGAEFAPPCCDGGLGGVGVGVGGVPEAYGDGPVLMDRGDLGAVPGGILDGAGLTSPPCGTTFTPPPATVAPPLPGGLTMPPAQPGRITPTPQAQPMPFTP
jgi:hypothetical protein